MLNSKIVKALFACLFACTITLQAGCMGTNPPVDGQKKGMSNAGKGALIGTLAGAALGAITSGGKNRQRNAVIGAGLGVIAGAVAGSYMDEQEAKLRQNVASAGVGIDREGDSIVLNMPDSITFGFGSDRLNPQFYQVLDRIADVMRNYSSTLIVIEGHTDSVGSAQFNQDLSVRRAQAVANYLIQRGIMAQRLMAWGHGKTRPIASNDTDQGRAQNRRVEITIEPVTE